MDGNSSELEEDEEEGGRGKEGGDCHFVPQTPDQEAFLKEHFVTLADLSCPGMKPRWSTTSARILRKVLNALHPNYSHYYNYKI